jgi:uncharacterized cupin superfamily protein
MTTTPLDRRQLLVRSGLVTAGVVAGSVASGRPAAADTDRGGPVVGAWTVHRQDPDDFEAHGIWTFAAGGVVQYQDLYATSAGVPQERAFPALMGSWVSERGRSARYVMWSPFVNVVPGLPPLMARTSGMLSVDGDSIESMYLVEFSLPGTGTLASYDGQLTGSRLLA